VQTSVIEPLIGRNRKKLPGDIDLILVPEPHRAIAIQVKRIRVMAQTTHRDSTPGRQLGNITKRSNRPMATAKSAFARITLSSLSSLTVLRVRNITSLRADRALESSAGSTT